jgi:hypothetical protein
MRLRNIARLILCAVLLHSLAFGFETDQYNLPPAPLADIGAEVSEYAEQNIREAIGKINSEIVARQNCLGNIGGKSQKIKCDSPQKEREKLALLQSEDTIMRAIFNRLGAGFPPFTKSETWMDKHRFKAQPARYKTSFRQSIFFDAPSNYLTISSTVNLYGAQFGTDKIAHVFQQGFSYYKIYKRALASGATAEEAVEKAVNWGKSTENTFYGTLVSGVFSNADLCANFVGLKFYLNLTREIKIGNETKAAILSVKNGVWTFNENAGSRGENLLKPFLLNHLNEALNPSIFVVSLRSSVRKTVKQQSCKLWRARFPKLTQADFESETSLLMLWNGEDYGFKQSGKFITIANTCFADGKSKEIEN